MDIAASAAAMLPLAPLPPFSLPLPPRAAPRPAIWIAEFAAAI
jgi:hypothetical protein